MPLPFVGMRSERRQFADVWKWIGLISMGWFSSMFVLTVVRDAGLLLGWLGASGRGSDARRGGLAAAGARPRCRCWPRAISLVGLLNARRTAGRGARRRADRRTCRRRCDGFTIAQISDIHVGPTIKRPLRRSASSTRSTGSTPTWSPSPATWSTAACAELRDHVAPLAGAALAPRHLLRHRQPRVLLRRATPGSTSCAARHARADERARRRSRHGDARSSSSPASPTSAPTTSTPRSAAIRAPRSPARRARRRTARAAGAPAAQRRRRPRPRASTCSSPATRTAASSGLEFLRAPAAAVHRRPAPAAPMWVYTSRGTGYWGPPKRFGAPSEITLLRLVPGLTRQPARSAAAGARSRSPWRGLA